jgi:hypothetical protein
MNMRIPLNFIAATNTYINILLGLLKNENTWFAISLCVWNATIMCAERGVLVNVLLIRNIYVNLWQ